MSELVSNVLDLMRLDSGEIVLQSRLAQHLDDLVGAALNRCDERLAAHPVEVRFPNDLPPVLVDATLVVQMFANLLDNAAKYTPPGTRVSIAAASGRRIRARDGG